MRLATAVAAALLCWSAAATAWQEGPFSERPASPASAVVVVPFANLSGHAEDDWIGAGVAETVASDLRVAGATVLVSDAGRLGPRGNVGLENDAGGNGGSDNGESGGGRSRFEAYRVLGAVWAVEGGYRRVGDRLQLTSRVVYVETASIVYSTHVDGPLSGIFDAQDAVAEALVEHLVPRAPPPARIAGRASGVGGLADAIPARRAGPEAPRFAPTALAPAAEPLAVVPAETGPIPPRPVGLSEGMTGALALADAPPPAGDPQAAVGAQATRPDPAALEDAARGRRAARGRGRPGGFAAPPIAARPTTVIARTREAPRIDGRLDDAVWRNATHLTEFVQIAPVEGAPGSERTEVWMAYDDDNLYFAFYAHYSDPGMIRVFRADRDEIRGDDRISVLFDTFLDQQRAYQFTVNGYGVQGDSIVNATGRMSSSSRSMSMSSGSSSGTGSRSGGGGMSSMGSSGAFGIFGDDSWNALFETGGVVVSDGWTAEMAIPFKSLRYPARPGGAPHRWGFQITRIIRGKSEAQSWAPISRSVAGQLTQFGVLEGLADLSQSRNIEILPELTGVQFGSLDTGTGGYDERDPDGELGVGVKYGITPNLTADFTYNPDFSQIESDRPQVETNQRFALFYPEQRPFFLEGQDIFETATPVTLVHTRTIVDPRLGAKLTGKVGNATLGVVVADDEAAGRLDERSDPMYGASAQSFIGRARYDLYAESYLGGIATAREFGDTYNRIAGVDGRFRLSRTKRVNFLAIASETRDDVDGALAGEVFEADFTSQGRNLGYGVAHSRIAPGFRTATGFVPRVDVQQTSAHLSYRWWPETNILSWGPSVSYLRLYDFAGVLQDEQIQGTASIQLRNNVNFFGTVSRTLERYEEIDFQKNGYGFFGVVSGRVLSIVGGINWGDGVFYSTSPFLGRSTTGNFLVRWNATSRLRTELTGVYSAFDNPIEGTEIFNVKIFRARTTYQFTDRLLLRHIMEHNTLAVTLGNNVLLTYRINAGTVAHLGYDARYQQGRQIDSLLFPTAQLLRRNRAFFGKISYLFRY